MATLKNTLDLTGSIGNISFYERKDRPGTIARTKGGANRRKILTDPGMEGTRRSNKEFGGRSTASKYLLRGLQPLKPISDFNWPAALNKLLRPIQLLDTTSPWGQRSVSVSRAPYLLEGFQLNRKFSLEAIIHSPLALSVTDAGITLTVPALLPGTNLTVPAGSFTHYSLVLSAAWIPDLVFTTHGYQPAMAGPLPALSYAYSPWQLTSEPAAGCTLQLPGALLSGTVAASSTLMITAGILLGRPAKGDTMETIKYMGAGKVLAMHAAG